MGNITAIKNYFRVTENLGTAGMPLREQFADIAAAGYQVVINLASSASPGQLTDEEQVVQSLGMEYTAIPVIWERPQLDDLRRFFSVMDANQNRRIFVHCVANYRVSVFVFLYRTLRLATPPGPAWTDLTRIWTPDGIWSEFINQARSQI